MFFTVGLTSDWYAKKKKKKIVMEKKVVELSEAAKRAAMAAVWKEGGAKEAECLDALDRL